MSGAALRRVVFFADPPYYGGAEGYLSMLARARPSEAWQLSALLPQGDGAEQLAAELCAAGVTVRRYRRRAWADPRLWETLYAQLLALRGQILHMNLPWVYGACLSVPGPLAKAAGYRRVVTTEHLPMVARARRRMLVKMLLAPAVDTIIVHTVWNRDCLARRHRMPSRKMVVIPNGSPEAPAMDGAERERLRAELGAAPGEVVLAVVGRLTARKGHRFLLSALARLGGELPPWRLLVAGEGEEREALQRQAAELGLPPRVCFLGYRNDARRVIQASDLLVLPSLLETQPLVLTEAMASGLPVVASAIYGIPEIIVDGESGLLVPAGEVAPLVPALTRLLADPELRRRMGRAARRRYEERFTLARMAERTYAALEGRALA